MDEPQGFLGWAQVIIKMTATTAVIVIAGFLVWRLAGGFDLYAQKMDALTAQHSEMAAQYKASDLMTRRMLVVLRVMCVNAAKNEDARQNCLQETIP
jgi:hypothetical protein